MKSTLAGVSCTSPIACTAVGSSDYAPLAERWDGKRWSIQPMASPAGGLGVVLNAVSCASPTACTAVGRYVRGAGGPKALVERWNGTRWSIQVPSSRTGSPSGELEGVSCPSRNTCTAVGYTEGQYDVEPLAERWNGTNWSRQPLPKLTVETYSRLNDVSCSSRTACTAVGWNDAHALAERWNGKRWSIQPTPTPNGNQTTGVSCPSHTACTAVGSRTSPSGAETTLAERWNG
jgi:hypothetical protein